ncbi:MAG: hypothetical protein ACOYMA_02615 [Bacteroidia bacterium]
MNKDKILETIATLPNIVELDDLFEKLIFIEKIELVLKQANEGQVISHREMKDLVNSWHK